MNERPIQAITSDTLNELLAQARNSPRKRAIRCLHGGDWEHAHRMLNALTPGTYVRPHRHADRFKGEGFILLCGKIAVLVFDETGALNASASQLLSLSAGSHGMEIPPGVWHSLVALEDSVIYEVKGQPAGGYVQDSDKDFAAWSPAEGAPESVAFLAQLAMLAAQLGQ